MAARSTSVKLIDCLTKLAPDSSGYLTFSYSSSGRKVNDLKLNIGLINGQIIYSGVEQFSIENLFKIIRRYSIQTHRPAISNMMDKILQDRIVSKPLDKIFQLIQLSIIDESQLLRVLRYQILADLDDHLFRTGTWNFTPDTYLSACLPLKGYSIKNIIEASSRRIKSWEAIKSQINLDDILILKQEFISPKFLPLGQRDLIIDLIRDGQTISNIAHRIVRDELDVCYMFIAMMREDIVSIPRKVVKSVPLPPPIRPILAIDSSDSMLSRLYAFIDELGYPCMRCNDVGLAIEVLRRQSPALILIELNMLGFGEDSIIHAIKENSNLIDVPVGIMVDEGRKISRVTASLNNYYEVQKPDFDTGAKFKEQISGILSTIKNSYN